MVDRRCNRAQLGAGCLELEFGAVCVQKSAIQDLLRSCLQGQERASGSVLYTGFDTLRPGPVYIMGYNPGGDPNAIREPIVESAGRDGPWSAYTHDCWQKGCVEPCRHREGDRISPDFLSRHQKRMIGLLANIGLRPDQVPSANAIFARSTRAIELANETGRDEAAWWNDCWPVHQTFLSIVRPRCIITLGKGETRSAYRLIRDKMSAVSEGLIGEGRRGARRLEGMLDLGGHGSLRVSVIGVPHPSYYATSDEAAAMIKIVAGGANADDSGH